MLSGEPEPEVVRIRVGNREAEEEARGAVVDPLQDPPIGSEIEVDVSGAVDPGFE
jgi:hypothetical protein